MMPDSTSRDRILSRLHGATKGPLDSIKGVTGIPFREPAIEEKIVRLKQTMEAMRAEVHVCSGNGWIAVFSDILRKKELDSLLYSPRVEIGTALEKHWNSRKDRSEMLPELIPYEQHVEDIKNKLFGIDAAITTAKGAIADDGAIILWPDENEPRLMSLVPPIHFAVLDAANIYSTLSEAMEKNCWNESMPTNALLISGPSKTADIELTLAFGVHGPKELILFIVEA